MHPDHTHIRQAAGALGFDVLGITSGAPLDEALAPLTAWCEAGHHGEMGYMARRPPERIDPRTLQRDVGTILSVAVNHHAAAPPFQAEGRFGRVARYAWGQDYHDVVLPRLRTLARELGAHFGGKARAACDHSPLMERAAAVRAGLGFFGKNTLLLQPQKGSWFLLGEVLLEAEIEPAVPKGEGTCGACTRCLEACPTDAFPAPFVLDSRRCISYLTIEHRGVIPRALRERMGPWVFGCDVCQEVCPFNGFANETTWPALRPEAGVGPRLDLDAVLRLPDDAAFQSRFAGTPLLRPGRAGLLRNAAIAAANVGAEGCVPILQRLVANDPDPVVRRHALWATAHLAPGRGWQLADQVRSGDPDEGVREEAADILAHECW